MVFHGHDERQAADGIKNKMEAMQPRADMNRGSKVAAGAGRWCGLTDARSPAKGELKTVMDADRS